MRNGAAFHKKILIKIKKRQPKDTGLNIKF